MYHDQTMKFTPHAAGLTPFYPWVCLLLTFALGNLILRCLTGSYMTIFSKSNYRVKLKVNMNIADFGKGRYFVLRVKQQTFDKARLFFKMINVNLAITKWRENDRNLLSPFAIILKLSRKNIIRKITSLPWTPRLYQTFQKVGQEMIWRIRTLLKCYPSDERARGF